MSISRWTPNKQKIALKLIDQGPDPDRQEIAEAERRGAMLQARLCGVDQRIARVFGYGDHDGFFYIEMEYVEGQDLSEVLAKSPLGVPFAAASAATSATFCIMRTRFRRRSMAMQYHGIVHGDIKPRNIRITPDGQVKILDFGIAKALSLTRKFTTNQFGSSQYSSPERLNTGDVDIASDLWSVGVVLYEIVTGKPYFQGEPSSRLEHAIRNYSAVRSDSRNRLPEPFRAILRKALAVNPERRYRLPPEFAADLNSFLEGRTTTAEACGRRTRTPEATRRTSRPLKRKTRRSATRRTAAPVAGPDRFPERSARKPVSGKKKAPLTPRQRQIRFFASLAFAPHATARV